MFKDIGELIDPKIFKKGAKTIEKKSIVIAKIAKVLQEK